MNATFEYNSDADYSHTVSFSGDGRLLASSWSVDDTIKLYDVEANTEILTNMSGRVVAISHDGTLLASGTDQNNVNIFLVTTGEILHVLSGHTDFVRFMEFSQDDSMLVTGSYDSHVKTWDTATGDLLNTYSSHTSGVLQVAFSNDGSLIISGSKDNTAIIWDVSSVSVSLTYSPAYDIISWISTVALNPRSSLAAIGYGIGGLETFDTTTGALQQSFYGHGWWMLGNQIYTRMFTR